MVAFGGGERAFPENAPVSSKLEPSASQGDLGDVGRVSRVRAAAAAFGTDGWLSVAAGAADGPQLTRVPSVSRVRAAAAALEAAYGGTNGGTTPRGESGTVAAALARFRQVNEEASSRPPLPLRHSTSVPSVVAIAPRVSSSSAASSPREPAASSAAPSAPPPSSSLIPRVAGDADASSTAPQAPADSASALPSSAAQAPAPSELPARHREEISQAQPHTGAGTGQAAADADAEPSRAPAHESADGTAETEIRSAPPSVFTEDVSEAAARPDSGLEEGGAAGGGQADSELTPTAADDVGEIGGLADGAAPASDGPVALDGLRGKGLPVGMLSPDECIFSPAQRRKSGSSSSLMTSPWQFAGAAFPGGPTAGSSPSADSAASDAAEAEPASADAPGPASAAPEADDIDDDVPCEIREVDGVLLCTAHAARFQRLFQASAAVPMKRTGSRFDLLTDFAARRELESLCTEVADLEAIATPTPAVLSKPTLLVGGRRVKQRRKKPQQN